MLFILTGHVPSKKNSKQIVCRGRFPQVLPSKIYQEWHTEKMWILKGSPTLTGPIKITRFHLWSKDKRASDIDNKLSSVLDLFKDAGIIEDDNWNIVRRYENVEYMGVDKENPRAEIELESYPQE